MAALNLGSSCALATHPQYSAYQGKQGALQSGSHALEVLSCTYGTRVCCHSTVLKDDRLFLWYYDACGIIYTHQILSLIHDFEKTAAIIVALASCTPERFGMLPTKIMKPPTPYGTSFPPCNLTGSVLSVKHPVSGKLLKITLKDSLYSQYVLTGRRTFVYTMDSSPTLATQSLMVKFAYQVNTRPPEYEFINIARKAGVDHLPEFHMCTDLWKMSDGARRVFFAHEREADYEDRTLRMTVYTKYGSIKKLFFERCDLIPVMVDQMLNCEYEIATLDIVIDTLQVYTTYDIRQTYCIGTSVSIISCSTSEAKNTGSSLMTSIWPLNSRRTVILHISHPIDTAPEPFRSWLPPFYTMLTCKTTRRDGARRGICCATILSPSFGSPSGASWRCSWIVFPRMNARET